MNPINRETKDLKKYFFALKNLYPKAYDKTTTDPYTKTRVILMNGTEFESVWFMHQFARHCDEPEILEKLAIVRAQEQQQQKRISCLKPIDESILETTIAYEQLAVDLTASLAINETDKTNREALNFALLEDFDHLYRFSNLLLMDKKIEAEGLVGGYTEIMPGRPTIAEHRCPVQNLKPNMNAKKAKLYSKLVACTITAAEQQTMNYYMNIAQWYKNDLGRKLYSEIALVEEEHVTQYESLKDPNMTWLEQWVMHEYAECYLYYSAYEDETHPEIKAMWLEHFEMECAHLKTAIELLEKFEKKSYQDVIDDGEFPELLKIGSHKEYIREVLERTVTLTSKNKDYKEVDCLKDDDVFFKFQEVFIGDDEETVPSHMVIEKAIDTFGEDYRFQESAHPVQELKSRKCDNTTLARTKE
ncbi:MAG: hypothetical protein IJF22_02110 [Clostridia bacterium]|nr:hypothetical protein [Clostridia bacterium]